MPYIFDRCNPNRKVVSILACLMMTFALLASSVISGTSHTAYASSDSVPSAVATFESIGLYWSPEDGSAGNLCTVHYRPAGSSEWKEALELWYDERNTEYRGSIIGLAPGTAYEVKLTLMSGNSQTMTVSTWSEEFPVGITTQLPELSAATLSIEESGTEDAYRLYLPLPDKSATIDVNNLELSNIYVNASYVIIRGLTLKNAQKHGIILGPNAHHVVIEDNDISGWGAIAGDGWGAAGNCAVYSNQASIHNIVVQRNKIHHPRSDSNNWSEPRPSYKNDPHPEGPQAISFYNNNQGNNVIRYNEIYSDFEHMFNDGIGGGDNFSLGGFPGRDSDVYGNIVTHSWDNPLEIEGGGMNVRVWGNYTDNSYTSISNASVSLGPLYIFRNVSNKCYKDHTLQPGSSTRFLKSGSVVGSKDNVYYGDGRVYVFHNTVLQEPDAEGILQGCNGGIDGSAGVLTNTVSRNNIFNIVNSNERSLNDNSSYTSGPKANDLDYDLFNGTVRSPFTTSEAHGIKGVPIFDSSNGNMYDPFQTLMRFALSPNSKGYDAGIRIKNFNDNFTGKAPDMGAHEAGTLSMQFGVNAYRSYRDLTPPAVAVHTPAMGSIVSDIVRVSAEATDDVGVAGVQFKLDGANLGTELKGPDYALDWNTKLIRNGAHTLTAVARDAIGHFTTSAEVKITVNNGVDTSPPMVEVTSPGGGEIITKTVTLSAYAADNFGVTGVQFQLDGKSIGDLIYAEPYRFVWDSTTVSNGEHVITAIARDAAGNETTSSAVLINIQNILFVDNFEAAVSGVWKTNGGTWKLGKEGNNQVYLQTNPSGSSRSYTGSVTWSDYSFEAKVKPINFPDKKGYIGIMARYLDSGNTYYLNMGDTAIQLQKKVGGETITLNKKSYPIQSDTWYTLKIVVHGNQITGYVNGNQEVTANDDTFVAGSIALSTSGSVNFFV